ncbi:hypothetical protein AB0C51_21835 [Streptomyces pathocidini]|uniref:hypothetical protein n=1 Tax=Streptomyces pathocidini TaxID=1650571 RepID=UPI0033F738CF
MPVADPLSPHHRQFDLTPLADLPINDLGRSPVKRAEPFPPERLVRRGLKKPRTGTN